MNHWLILILSAIAMVAILVVFMWWWTTDNWDWASAELKPPRPVPQETKPLKAYLDWVNWREELEQRVRALEEEMGTDDPTRWTLRDRIVGLEQQIGVLQGAATPSPPTAPDLTPGPTANVTMPTSLKGVKVHMEKTEAPTTLTP